MVRRPPPPPATGRKPQVGRAVVAGGLRGSVLGQNLSYLLHLAESNVSLRDLAAQELELRLKHGGGGGAGAFTAPLHFDLAGDLLRLDAQAIARLTSNGTPTFRSSDVAVSIILEFLGSRDDLPALGVVPAGQAGDLFVGWVNLERVRELTGHAAVVHVETMSTWVVHVETMISPLSAGDVGQGEQVAAEPQGAQGRLTGRGVCLAVIDLCFDFLHPGFLRETDDGEAVRSLWLHDMGLPRPDTSPPGEIGRRFNRLELEDALRWYNSPQLATRSPAVDRHCGRLSNLPGVSQEYRRSCPAPWHRGCRHRSRKWPRQLGRHARCRARGGLGTDCDRRAQ